MIASRDRDLFSQSHEKPMPRGGLRRLFGTARAAAKTGVSVLSGRLRRSGEEGLGAADLAAIEQLVTSLGRLKGLPMKIGQIMGYIDVTLPPEMRELLSLLQTQSQPSRSARGPHRMLLKSGFKSF